MAVRRPRLWSVHPLRTTASVADWLRGPATLEATDVIVLDIDRAELYDPSAEPGVLFDLAAIREPHDALGFVRRRGLLWGGGVSSDPPDDADFGRESFDDWREVALNLNWLLYRYAIGRKAREPDGLKELSGYWARTYLDLGWQGNWIGEEEHAELLEQMRQPERWNTDALLYDLRVELAEDIDEQVRDKLRLRCKATDELEDEGSESAPSDFVITAEATDLEAMAYYELLLEVSSGAVVEVCPVDGRIFPVRDPRQRYCSPQCAGRARYRRFAAKPTA